MARGRCRSQGTGRGTGRASYPRSRTIKCWVWRHAALAGRVQPLGFGISSHHTPYLSRTFTHPILSANAGKFSRERSACREPARPSPPIPPELGRCHLPSCLRGRTHCKAVLTPSSRRQLSSCGQGEPWGKPWAMKKHMLHGVG